MTSKSKLTERQARTLHLMYSGLAVDKADADDLRKVPGPALIDELGRLTKWGRREVWTIYSVGLK
jgi:hypothetical protein